MTHMPLHLIALLLATPHAPMQEAPSAASPPPALSLEARVEEVLRPFTEHDAPGWVLLIGRGDEVVLERAGGLADLERGVPMSTDAVLDIGSTSKQFTAAAVLLLELEGELALSDALREHLPELPECFDPVTLRHMLLHTSGIPDYIGLMIRAGAEVADRTTAAEALESLKRVEELQFAPGARWSYSNSNYFLLSQVVERAAERSLAKYAQERIFDPLGMTSTHIHDDSRRIVLGRALSYERAKDGAWRHSQSSWEQTGDGAVFTSVGDLFRWSRNFKSGAVGGEELLQAMSERGALDDGTAIDYGMGLVFFDQGELAGISHGGSWAGYRAELMRVPVDDLVVILLCNRGDMNPSVLCSKIAVAAREHFAK